jgi:hypothetical protein
MTGMTASTAAIQVNPMKRSEDMEWTIGEAWVSEQRMQRYVKAR